METFKTSDFHQADVLLNVKVGFRPVQQSSSSDGQPGVGEREAPTPATKEDVTTHTCGAGSILGHST